MSASTVSGSPAFDDVLEWLREERDYQIEKFDYEQGRLKDVPYWEQQFASYIQRIALFGLDTQQGAQAALKLTATAAALAEHFAEKMQLPAPGVPSGTYEWWENRYA